MFLPQLIGGLLQEKPKVPDYKKVNLTDSQREATDANIGNFDRIKGLAADVNQFNQDELLKHLRQVIPGYDQLISKTRGIVDSQLSGEIPQDVQDAISRNSAARALQGGYGGSQMQGNLTARDLGLTSYNIMNQGLASADRWIQTARQNLMPNTFDVTKMFISPTEQWKTTMENNTNQFNRDWQSNQLDAEYSLGTIAGRALIKTDDQIMQIISSVAGSAGGMMAACWVAREVFGVDNPKWKQFREWMLTESHPLFRWTYLRFGERFAKFISDKPKLKSIVKNWMETKISGRGNLTLNYV